MARKLSPMQERFVDEYMKDLNAAQAAIRAGYSAKTASRIGPELLGKTLVAEAVQKAKEKRAKRVELDAAWVVRRLVRNANRAASAEPVRDKEGNPTGEYRYEGSVVNKALELLGRHLGMFVDRVEVAATTRLEVVEEVVDAPADGSPNDGQTAPGPGGLPAQ